MPAPDPTNLWLEDVGPGRWRIVHHVWAWGNETQQRRRATRLLRNYAHGWHCPECGELIEPYKRADAVYCRERCRKAAAAARRKRRKQNAETRQ